MSHLDNFVCNESLCNTHFDSIFLFRDEEHFSNEGSAALGKKSNFYGMIVDSYSLQNQETISLNDSLIKDSAITN